MGEAVGHHPPARLLCSVSSPIACAAVMPSSTPPAPAGRDWRRPRRRHSSPPAVSSRTEAALPSRSEDERWTRCNLFGRSEQVLDMMAEFMRDHIILREIALGAEAVGQFVEEAGVQIDSLVGRAVERPHRRLRRAAARATIAAVEDQRGAWKRWPDCAKIVPSLLRGAEGVARGAAVGIGGAGVLRGGAALPRATRSG